MSPPGGIIIPSVPFVKLLELSNCMVSSNLRQSIVVVVVVPNRGFGVVVDVLVNLYGGNFQFVYASIISPTGDLMLLLMQYSCCEASPLPENVLSSTVDIPEIRMRAECNDRRAKPPQLTMVTTGSFLMVDMTRRPGKKKARAAYTLIT